MDPISTVLAFDQAPTHTGWARIDLASGRAVEVGSMKTPRGNRDAAGYVCEIVARYPIGLAAVALEGTYLATKKTNENGEEAIKVLDEAFKVLDQLAELRGRILQELEENQRLRVFLVPPSKWQADINCSFQKRAVVKAWSLKMARSLCIDPTDLNEDCADAVHIGRFVRGILLEEEQLARYGPRQRSLI